MIEIGRSLPNLTDPAATTGAAERLAFKAFSLFRPRPCRAAPAGSTLFGALRISGLRHGRHPAARSAVRHGAARQFRVCRCRASTCAISATAKRSALSVIPSPLHVRRNAELIAKRDRLHDLDIAILGARRDADRTRMQVAHAGEGFQEDVMVGRIFGDHRHAGHGLRAVGMGLKRRIPEILREMMLAHRKAHIRRCRIAGESQRERKLDRRAVGLCRLRGAKSNTSKPPMPAASNERASSAALLLLRISIERPSRARESRG